MEQNIVANKPQQECIKIVEEILINQKQDLENSTNYGQKLVELIYNEIQQNKNLLFYLTKKAFVDSTLTHKFNVLQIARRMIIFLDTLEKYDIENNILLKYKETFKKIDLEKFKKSIAEHDKDKILDEQTNKNYIINELIDEYLRLKNKEEIEKNDLELLKKFGRTIRSIHGLKNDHHLEYYTEIRKNQKKEEFTQIPTEKLLEYAIDSSSIGIYKNGEIIGDFFNSKSNSLLKSDESNIINMFHNVLLKIGIQELKEKSESIKVQNSELANQNKKYFADSIEQQLFEGYDDTILEIKQLIEIIKLDENINLKQLKKNFNSLINLFDNVFENKKEINSIVAAIETFNNFEEKYIVL